MTRPTAAHHEFGEKPTSIDQPAVLQRSVWQHSFGAMLIEVCVDGSAWIDSKPVRDTVTNHPLPQAAEDLAAGPGASIGARDA